MKIRTISLTAFAMFVANCATAQIAHLAMHSDPGDFIGLGQNYDLTFAGDEIYARIDPTYPVGIPKTVNFVLRTPDPMIEGVYLTFSSEGLGSPLTTAEYLNAKTYNPFYSGSAGIYITMSHRGGGNITGSFKITDFTYTPSLEIQSFSATFEQHIGGLAPALTGTIFYSSVPEPIALTYFAIGLPLLAALSQRRMRRINPSKATYRVSFS